MVDRRRFPPCRRKHDGVICWRRGEHFCEPRAAHALAFFTELLVHTKGIWARQAFIPAEWEEREVLRPLFGVVEWDAGWRRYVRRYRELYLSTGRKNGKSELVAGIMLYLLSADQEEAAELYGLALDKDQAALVYGAAERMVKLSPVLAARLRCWAVKRITYEPTASFFTIMAGDALGALGPNPHAAYIDELLTQPDRTLYDALRTGFGARAQPMMVLATTADSDPGGFAAQEREWSEGVLADPLLDRRRLVVIHAAPKELDWLDEAGWFLANPALGDYLDIGILRDEAAKAVNNPPAQRAFEQFRLNRQSEAAGRALDLAVWDASAGPVPHTDLPGRLRGQPCFGGLDLASTSDLAAYCLDFPRPGGAHALLWRCFCPAAALPGLDRRTGGRASVWAREGWLTVTEGNVIDYEAIKIALRADALLYDIREIGFDRWGATQLASQLLDEGVPLIQVGQGYAAMSAPTKELLRLTTAGLYHHGGSPLVRWQAGNLVTRSDPAGNLKPDKPNSRDKVDAIVAAIMALDRAIRNRAAQEDDEVAAGF